MAGFQIQNTLSENGAVTRGVCKTNENNELVKVVETGGIQRDPSGQIVCEGGQALAEETPVSMNLWGLTPEFLPVLKEKFVEFLQQINPQDLKAEYLLPSVIDQMLQSGQAVVKVLPTPDKWFGVTYAEDKDSVEKAFCELMEAGVYGGRLWD